MTGLEYARLQGAGNFNLDGFRDSQIQYAFGDAVAVPVVTWLMEQSCSFLRCGKEIFCYA